MKTVFGHERFVLAHFFTERENVYHFQPTLSRFFSHDLVKSKNSFMNVAAARIFVAGRSYSEIGDRDNEQSLLVWKHRQHLIYEVTEAVPKRRFVDALNPIVHADEQGSEVRVRVYELG